MKNSRFVASFILLAIACFGCKLNDSECLVTLDIPIIQNGLPDSGYINQPIKIPIQVVIGNGCGRFQNVQVDQLSNQQFVYAKGTFDGCICTLQITNVDTSFSYLPTVSGNMIFNFSDDNGNYAKDSIYIRP